MAHSEKAPPPLSERPPPRTTSRSRRSRSSPPLFLSPLQLPATVGISPHGSPGQPRCGLRPLRAVQRLGVCWRATCTPPFRSSRGGTPGSWTSSSAGGPTWTASGTPRRSSGLVRPLGTPEGWVVEGGFPPTPKRLARQLEEAPHTQDRSKGLGHRNLPTGVAGAMSLGRFSRAPGSGKLSGRPRWPRCCVWAPRAVPGARTSSTHRSRETAERVGGSLGCHRRSH